MKIKFPAGKIGNELTFYMGFDDEQNLHQRPQIVQDLYHANKCVAGKEADYSIEEINQLIKEVDNAIDIKADHVYNERGSEWNSLNQYHLANFGAKLKALIS